MSGRYHASSRPRDYRAKAEVPVFVSGTEISKLIAAAYCIHLDLTDRQFLAIGGIKQLARWAACHSADCVLAASVSPRSEGPALVELVRGICKELTGIGYLATPRIEALADWCEQHTCGGTRTLEQKRARNRQCLTCGAKLGYNGRGQPPKRCEQHRRR